MGSLLMACWHRLQACANFRVLAPEPALPALPQAPTWPQLSRWWPTRPLPARPLTSPKSARCCAASRTGKCKQAAVGAASAAEASLLRGALPLGAA